ncbi:NifR3 family TIM-barrel protein [Alcanivorax balearicus MACL04]|uniref:tRNA-dihydrouridine synthase B n=1 Tax=Alloalcanivorax balearicus MACL04 TaxID=1177182 RepID=A0ABT2QUI9_9GAMM|nr:tRNA dihydrouridine synthase DusB [Alloalcanivorax balearicus]MCU5781189.1 NifR3 family TIM-barrel protein [Alloalcanivorax balearicus MACL04]
MRIGPHALPNPVILAPMAGVTDRPFRRLCRELGAGLVVSEMVTSDTRLWQSAKSSRRLDHSGEPGPISVQIAGADPRMMAEAARANVDLGAQIIDINMGCPAKKVCKRAAGSALLSEPELVTRILESVVAAVPVPVTLKIRTGPTRDNRNAVLIARIAEQSGIQALAIHGRTRADRFNGEAEFDTIGEVARSVEIPVIANGDIDSPQKAQRILQSTGAGGIMIGRAAQGNPWIFQDTVHYLEHGRLAPAPSVEEVRARVLAHLSDLHDFYGTYSGVRIARKHLGWYTQSLPGGEHFRRGFNNLEKATDQRRAIEQFFQQISASSDRLRIGCYGGVSARNKDGALAA